MRVNSKKIISIKQALQCPRLSILQLADFFFIFPELINSESQAEFEEKLQKSEKNGDALKYRLHVLEGV